jgi:DNA-binding transcriptional ArsR family regulator
MISLYLEKDDLKNIRFAYSPLTELVTSFKVFTHGERHGMHRGWLDEAERALHGIDLPYMRAMMGTHRYIADFVTPTPEAPVRDFEIALEEVRQTPPEIVRESASIMIETHGDSEARQHFMVYPTDALDCLAQEMSLYWRATLAQHWDRIRTVLDNDILFHARRQALEGTETMFSGLSDGFRYQQGALQIVKEFSCHQIAHAHSLEGEGIQFVPAVFMNGGHGVMWMVAPHWRPLILYGARGAGLWYRRDQPEPEQALRAAFGDARAGLLAALQRPGHTTELAQRLCVTSGAVSQQLSKLAEAGLVNSHRSGYRVYYRLSERGEQLMALFMQSA